MPEVPSQAASHTICQAVSHMDLLIKGGAREEKRGGGGGRGGESGLLIPHPVLLCTFSFHFSQI